MPRPVRPWFRFYVEAFPDRKIRRLKPAQRWVWVAVLGAARESHEPGKLYVAPGLPMTRRELADYAGVTDREVESALAKMLDLGMIALEGDLITVPAWDKRQFESDNVTERVRRSRARSGVPTEDVGTLQPRSRERRRNTPDTETETEVPVLRTGGADEVTAQTLVGEWLDHCPTRPPSRVVGQVARELRLLLEEQIDPQLLRRALAEWHRKGLHPSTLPSVVHEVNTRGGKTARQADEDALWQRAMERAEAREREAGLR